MRNWLFRGKEVLEISQLPNAENLNGFVYRVINLKTGQVYIGKKNFYSVRKRDLPKSEISTDKRKKTYEHIVKESDWKKYWGSSKDLVADIKELGYNYFSREILQVTCSPKHLTYLEIKFQFSEGVIENSSYNGNILGKFYPRDVNPCNL